MRKKERTEAQVTVGVFKGAPVALRLASGVEKMTCPGNEELGGSDGAIGTPTHCTLDPYSSPSIEIRGTRCSHNNIPIEGLECSRVRAHVHGMPLKRHCTACIC